MFDLNYKEIKLKIAAFVGHSFTKEDEKVVTAFLEMFDNVKRLLPDFTWDHAINAEPKELKQKVLSTIEDKNLFIGICTRKEYTIREECLKKSMFPRKKLHVDGESLELKTSDWIIQEIGLAVGRGMDIIILLEDGVRMPGGLLGDLEYITFKRDNPAGVFTKLSQMITSLRPNIPKERLQSNSVGKSESETIDSKNLKELKLTPGTNWGAEDYGEAFITIAAEQKDEHEVEILKHIDENIKSEEDKSSILCGLYLSKFYFHRDTDDGQKSRNLLIEEAKKYPNNIIVNQRLATMHTISDQYEDAAKVYEKIIELHEQVEDQLDSRLKATRSYLKAGFIKKAETMFGSLTESLLTSKELQVSYYNTLALLHLKKEKELEYCLYLEKSLELEPEDHGLRFDLAFKYGEIGLYNCSMFHYQALVNKRQDSSDQNNLGVAYTQLGLQGMGVKAYLTSKKLGGTMAVGNLAEALIKVGFYDLAKEYCLNVVEREDCEANVLTAITSIKEKEIEEQKVLSKELNKIMVFREFLAKVKNDRVLGGAELDYLNLKGEEGVDFKVYFEKDGSFYSSYEFLVDEDQQYSIYKKRSSGVKGQKFSVTIKGSLIGMWGTFEKYVKEQGSTKTLLGGQETKIFGYFFVTEEHVEYLDLASYEVGKLKISK